ncbi:hypothetical protein ACTWPB_25595 [Nocardia sp. IBHARD005]|uniref:hypothetical protein n=1 Tax=Nocardia sp. IBHARD005 TaxID=3457765 RepID=UPI004059E4BD
MSAVRVLLALLGIGLTGYGIALLSELSRTDLVSVGVWFAAGIVLHDALFAPLCVVVGVGARRILPGTWWAAAACGAVATVAVVVLAVPVVGRGDALPDNPTVLDRDYPAGVLAAVVTVWVFVVLGAVTRRGVRAARLVHRRAGFDR